MTRRKKTTPSPADDAARGPSPDPVGPDADDGQDEPDADDEENEDDPGDDGDASGPPECPVCGEDSGMECCGHLVADEDVLEGSLDGGFLYDEPMEKLVGAFTAILAECPRFIWCGSPLREFRGSPRTVRWPDFPIVLQFAELLIGDGPEQVATEVFNHHRDATAPLLPGHDHRRSVMS